MTPSRFNARRLPRIADPWPVFFVALAFLLVGAWSGHRLMTDGGLDWKAAALSLAVLAVLSVLALRLPAEPPVQWFCLLTAGALPLVPAWFACILGVLALRFGGRRRWAVAIAALALLAGVANRLIDLYGLGGDTLLAFVQTNLNEAADFVLANTDFRVVAAFAAYVGVLFTFVRRSPLFPPGGNLAAALLVYALCAQAAAQWVEPVKALRRQLLATSGLVTPPPVATTHRPLDVVLLLGEATSRWHMQLYGYPYPTNPRLSAWRDELVILPDAISAHSHTVQSLSTLLQRPGADGSNGFQSLIGRLRAAGVSASWFSTQMGAGPWDSPIRRVARESGEVVYFPNRGFTLPGGLDYLLNVGSGFSADADMVQRLVADLQAPGSDNGKLRVAHFTAAHADYCRNIPHRARDSFGRVERGERYFGAATDRTREVNCYDAALAYLDGLIDQVVATARQRERPTLVIFAPDHGEDPDGGTGHSNARHSARHVEIPVVIFANAAARRQNPEGFAHLTANAPKPFFLPWLHETVLDAFGVAEAFRADTSLSLFSASYMPVPRLVFRADQPMHYDRDAPFDRKDYLSRTRLNMANVEPPRPRFLLAHRTNSELALLEAMPYFHGVEMDLVFDEAAARFEVRHPPLSSSGYTLERALEIAAWRPELALWLDWKNPSNANLPAAVAELERLDARFGIKRRAWIETAPAFQQADTPLLQRHGYRHAYYLQVPADVAASCRPGESETVADLCRSRAQAEARIARGIGASHLSFDWKDAGFANEVLRADPSLKALTWDLAAEASQRGFQARVREVQSAEAAIVPFPTPYLR